MFDNEIEELIWTDSPNGVKVEGRVRAKGNAPTGGGFLDMLASLGKPASQVADEKRESYEAEKELEESLCE